MNDIYEKFAFDYDEFGSIENYLGDEKNFFDRIFRKHNVRTIWIVPVVQGSTYTCCHSWDTGSGDQITLSPC